MSEKSKLEVMTPDQCADFLKVAPRTLQAWRQQNPRKGPPFIRVTGSIVRYLKSEVVKWMEEEGAKS